MLLYFCYIPGIIWLYNMSMSYIANLVKCYITRYINTLYTPLFMFFSQGPRLHVT